MFHDSGHWKLFWALLKSWTMVSVRCNLQKKKKTKKTQKTKNKTQHQMHYLILPQHILKMKTKT